MAIINQQNFQIKNGNDWYKLCPFPVGYIYMSTNNTSPATTYGGTWSALSDSKFLRPSGSWNSTGGSTTITIDNMPSHTHSFSALMVAYNEIVAGSNNSFVTGGKNAPEFFPSAAAEISSTGGGQLTGNLTELVIVGIAQPNFFFEGGDLNGNHSC